MKIMNLFLIITVIITYSCEMEQDDRKDIALSDEFVGTWKLVRSEQLLRGQGAVKEFYDSEANIILRIEDKYLFCENGNLKDSCEYKIEEMENKHFLNLYGKNEIDCVINEGYISNPNDTLVIDGSYNDIGKVWYFKRIN